MENQYAENLIEYNMWVGVEGGGEQEAKLACSGEQILKKHEATYNANYKHFLGSVSALYMCNINMNVNSYSRSSSIGIQACPHTH